MEEKRIWNKEEAKQKGKGIELKKEEGRGNEEDERIGMVEEKEKDEIGRRGKKREKRRQKY